MSQAITTRDILSRPDDQPVVMMGAQVLRATGEMQLRAISLLGMAALLAATPADSAKCPRGTLTGAVTYVRDGDTIVVGSMPIRLNGLAAPEGDEPGGARATRAMLELVEGREVRCELDGQRTYDRCVAVCYLEGVDIAAEMVAAGLARDCPRFSGGRYREAERQAAAAGAAIRASYQLPGYCTPR
jgi:micrococcal nuclease